MALLGEITVTPPDPQPGQTVLVEVFAPDGSPYAGAADAPTIRINGITGPRQYVQFARSGPRQLPVAAEQDGQAERIAVDVTVGPSPAPQEPQWDGLPAPVSGPSRVW